VRGRKKVKGSTKRKVNIGQLVWEWTANSCDNVRMAYDNIKERLHPYIPQTIVTKTMQPNHSSLVFSFGSHYICLSKLKSSSGGSAAWNCKQENIVVNDMLSLEIVTNRSQNSSTKSWESFTLIRVSKLK